MVLHFVMPVCFRSKMDYFREAYLIFDSSGADSMSRRAVTRQAGRRWSQTWRAS